MRIKGQGKGEEEGRELQGEKLVEGKKGFGDMKERDMLKKKKGTN